MPRTSIDETGITLVRCPVCDFLNAVPVMELQAESASLPEQYYLDCANCMHLLLLKVISFEKGYTSIFVDWEIWLPS